MAYSVSHQPLAVAILLELGLQLGGAAVAAELGVGLAEHGLLERDRLAEGDAVVGHRAERAELGGEQPLVAEVVRAEQDDVAGERAERLVRAVAVAGGAEREDLPPGLTGGGEGLDPLVRLRAEVADAVGAGQTGRVE